jgi:hypothetical protein
LVLGSGADVRYVLANRGANRFSLVYAELCTQRSTDVSAFKRANSNAVLDAECGANIDSDKSTDCCTIDVTVKGAHCYADFYANGAAKCCSHFDAKCSTHCVVFIAERAGKRQHSRLEQWEYAWLNGNVHLQRRICAHWRGIARVRKQRVERCCADMRCCEVRLHCSTGERNRLI